MHSGQGFPITLVLQWLFTEQQAACELLRFPVLIDIHIIHCSNDTVANAIASLANSQTGS